MDCVNRLEDAETKNALVGGFVTISQDTPLLKFLLFLVLECS
jgi:hypothetical protein